MFRRGKDAEELRGQRRAIKQATREYRKKMRRAEVNASATENVIRSRQRDIERSSLGPYSKGILLFSDLAGCRFTIDLTHEIGCQTLEQPERRDLAALSRFADLPQAKWHLRGYEQAWRTAGWAYWRYFMSIHTDYWEELDAATPVLAPLTDAEYDLPRLGPVPEDEQLEDFAVTMICSMHLAGVGEPLAEEHARGVLELWHTAWDQTWTDFRERFEAHFDDLDWPFSDPVLEGDRAMREFAEDVERNG